MATAAVTIRLSTSRKLPPGLRRPWTRIQDAE